MPVDKHRSWKNHEDMRNGDDPNINRKEEGGKPGQLNTRIVE